MNFAVWFLQNFCVWLNFCGYPFAPKFNLYIHSNRHKWVSKGRKSPCGTRFCGTQSLVCYTFVPSAVKRMSVALHDSRLFTGAEQTDKFRNEQEKFIFLSARERNKRYIKIPPQRNAFTKKSFNRAINILHFYNQLCFHICYKKLSAILFLRGLAECSCKYNSIAVQNVF